MNNEQYNQIIDEAYENYQNYPLATRHDHRTNLLYQNIGKGWCMLNGRSMASPHPTRHLTKEEFINKIKTDSEFSEQWELKIEETYDLVPHTQICADTIITRPVRKNKIIVTYKDKTIESYE